MKGWIEKMRSTLKGIFKEAQRDYKIISKTYKILVKTYDMKLQMHSAGQWILDKSKNNMLHN